MRTILLLILAASALPSCTLGPDYTPDVAAHAASFSGAVPIFDANGRMAGMQATGVSQSRPTMFHP